MIKFSPLPVTGKNYWLLGTGMWFKRKGTTDGQHYSFTMYGTGPENNISLYFMSCDDEFPHILAETLTFV